MTYKEIISCFNELRPNNISDDYKAKIIRELDIKVNNEVFYDKRDIPSLDEVNENTKGLIEEPYDDLYILYLICKLDFYLGDYERYSNDTIVFNTEYLEYLKFKTKSKAVKNKKIKVV